MNQAPVSTLEASLIAARPVGKVALLGSSLQAVIDGYRPISLDEMDGVALLSRMDTKYVFSIPQLIVALRNLRYRYQILMIDGQRIHHYRTLYYDTQSFELYHEHVTGQAEVYKVRSRAYLDSQLSFLEVKHKNRKQRTEKSRLPITDQRDCLKPQMAEFLESLLPFSDQHLEPKLMNTFSRITLVSIADKERVTIDLDLSFCNGQRSLSLGGIVVAEVKQKQYSNGSAFIAEMRRLGIRQTGFSKYCFGVSQLYASVKKNSQKEKRLMIEKIQRGGRNHVCYA